MGVTTLYGIDDIESILKNAKLRPKAEHSFTPESLVNELTGAEKAFFKLMFSEGVYKKIYRLHELGT